MIAFLIMYDFFRRLFCAKWKLWRCTFSAVWYSNLLIYFFIMTKSTQKRISNNVPLLFKDAQDDDQPTCLRKLGPSTFPILPNFHKVLQCITFELKRLHFNTNCLPRSGQKVQDPPPLRIPLRGRIPERHRWNFADEERTQGHLHGTTKDHRIDVIISHRVSFFFNLITVRLEDFKIK